MLKLAVLISGSGRTLDNFHERIQDGSLHCSIEVVISNVEGVLGIEKATNYGYSNFVAVDSEATNRILQDFDIDIVCLAGYLKLYNPPAGLQRRVINIHPSLIPMFCGPGYYGNVVHRAVKERGCMVSGCTVHFADEIYDNGPIIVQKPVPLFFEDTIDEIAARVFSAECEAYPEALNLVDEKGVEFFWERLAGR